MQEQEICEPLIDEMFTAMKDQGIYMGEIYTHLGFDKSNRQGIEDAAEELLKFITDDPKPEAE